MPPPRSSFSSDGGSPSIATDNHPEKTKSHHAQDNSNSLHMVRSHYSGHDMPAADVEFKEDDAEVYLRFSPARKVVILIVLSICSFLAPVSSTTVLSAIPEVAETFHSTESVLNGSNALYMAFMGIAAPFWGSFSQVWGRRPIFLVSGSLFVVFSLATALAPNLAAFYIFRVLTAFQGTSFLVVGSTAVGDIYEPRKRATALSWFLSGTLVGPALGPFIGGVIVTYRSWTVIFWLQTALGGLATILVFFLFPETYPNLQKADLASKSLRQNATYLWRQASPFRVGVLLFSYPNLICAAVAAGALVWNQYSLLTPIRSVLNPRFGLQTPIQAALFYLAPGTGYFLGTFLGGRWADYMVNKWIRKRGGRRIPEDRLKSCMYFVGAVIPVCVLIYGWSVQKRVGGIPLPVLAMFFQGLAQLFCFPSLNSYCIDVMQPSGRSAEVVAGNYLFRYALAALGSGVVLPAVNVMGVGWFSTISALFLIIAGICVWATTVFGDSWRRRIDARRQQRQTEERAK
ncbi:hypothetical protein N7492_008376 [Penicillium capsulatum]|uniref:Major facilitator superfamily (MFS) profile domain-containing protein n=1 Tax=Penicillium capsulatum TaxID=69766 RepID=A0A9W9HPL1_9EURO|nr:hypothetical protein N7492_008376 [Penicillium capsulatum]